MKRLNQVDEKAHQGIFRKSLDSSGTTTQIEYVENAAVGEHARLGSITEEQLDQMISTNEGRPVHDPISIAAAAERRLDRHYRFDGIRRLECFLE